MNKKIMKIQRTISFALCLIMTLAVMMPVTVSAEGNAEQKVVRVGWFESPFNITETNGERNGYAYEYQQAVASYTGWKYEYVTGA